MPYRVLIDGSKLLDPTTDGIKRYVCELLRALATQAGPQWSIDVALATGHRAPLQRVADKLEHPGWPLGNLVPALLSPGSDNPLWKCRARLEATPHGSHWLRLRDHIQCQSLRLARSTLRRWHGLRRVLGRSDAENYDLVHLTLPNTWRLCANVRAALVTTVHDLSHIACPAYQTHSNNESLREGLDFARRAVSRYVAVSASTASQMVELLGVDRASIDVIAEGVDRRRFSPAVDEHTRRRVVQRYALPEGPFLLCLGTIEPRKNLLNTVRAFRSIAATTQSLGAHLVIAGACGWGAHSELEREIAACPRIRRVGYVDEDDLPALYALCRAFCYVSHYEGFGLPVVEAMSCGAPVLYGNASSLPEVAGDAGVGAAPHDVESIAAAMRRLLVDDACRAALVQRATVRARHFDWDEAARKTLRSYAAQLAAVSLRDRPHAERLRVEAA